MALPTPPTRRRTRWLQGLIITASAVVITIALAVIIGRAATPTDETSPSTVSTTQTVLPESAAPSTPTVAPALVEPPAPTVEPAPAVAPAPVEQQTPSQAPTTTATAEPANITYDNCAAVWAASAAPIHTEDPGYDTHLDSDRDGAGCEKRAK